MLTMRKNRNSKNKENGKGGSMTGKGNVNNKGTIGNTNTNNCTLVGHGEDNCCNGVYKPHTSNTGSTTKTRKNR